MTKATEKERTKMTIKKTFIDELRGEKEALYILETNQFVLGQGYISKPPVIVNEAEARRRGPYQNVFVRLATEAEIEKYSKQ